MTIAILRLYLLLVAVCFFYSAPLQTAYSQEQAEQTAEQLDAGEAEAAKLVALASDASLPLDQLRLRLIPLTGEELGKVTEVWRRHVQSMTAETIEAQITVNSADDSASDAARETLLKTTEERNSLLERYSAVIDAWEQKGADAEAVAEYRTYVLALRAGQIQLANAETLLKAVLSWLVSADGGLQVLKNIGIVVVAIWGLMIAARIVRAFTSRRIDRVPNLSKLLQNFVVAVIYWLVLSFGLLVVLSLLGVDVTPLFALVGGASFIIGFAFQDTLGNFANGLMIMVNRPFDEGDFVDISGVTGTVKSVNIVATTVVTIDNQFIVIPNRQVWGNVIKNVTASETRRVDLTFGIGYDDDIPHAISVMKEAVTAHPKVLDTPEPLIVVKELGDSSVNFLCAPWVKTVDYWTVYWDLMADVKQRFDAAGISIPFPQRDVHIIQAVGDPPAS